jgi:hypothetical protein
MNGSPSSSMGLQSHAWPGSLSPRRRDTAWRTQNDSSATTSLLPRSCWPRSDKSDWLANRYGVEVWARAVDVGEAGKAMKTVADQFSYTPAAAGLRRVYGIGCDSLSAMMDPVLRQGYIAWFTVRHDAVAAFAAAIEAYQLLAPGPGCSEATMRSADTAVDEEHEHTTRCG